MNTHQLFNMLTNSAYAQETGGDRGPTSRPADTVVTSGLRFAAATEKVSEIGLMLRHLQQRPL
jgi:hypothetical protein